MATPAIPTNDYRAGDVVVSQLRFFDPDDVTKIWKNAANVSPPQPQSKAAQAPLKPGPKVADRPEKEPSQPDACPVEDTHQYDIFDERMLADDHDIGVSHPQVGGKTGPSARPSDPESGPTT